jgi:glycosyltransferase involved in cell wall biosynthesis
MRILYLSPTNSLGGAERVLLSVMTAVRRADPAADLYLMAPGDGPLTRRAEAAGVCTARLPLPAALASLGDSRPTQAGPSRRLGALLRQALAAAPAVWRCVGRLRRGVREIDPDVIHSNGIKTHLLCRLAWSGRAPVLWHVHDFYSHRPAARPLLRAARGGAAGAVAVSGAVARDARRALPGLPVAAVYNTVDTAEFAPADGDAAWLDAAAGLPPAAAGTVRVGLIATYARWKGHEIFLEAAARVAAAGTGRPVRFFVIGGPIYQTRGSQYSEAELRAIARGRGVEGRVGFVGFQDDPAGAFRALDVVVHASTRPEPFGLTIAEAMACGKPVVAARSGGAAELFRNGHDALGAPPGDARGLAAALTELVGDPVLRARLGENARRTALVRFNRDGLAGRFLRIYSVLGRGHRIDLAPIRGTADVFD